MKKYLILCVALTGCGVADAPPQAIAPVAMAGEIAVSEPRLRLPPPGTRQTAAYFTLTNTGARADRLVGASSPDARSLELHAHVKSGDGMMAMRALTAIDVPAGATIPLSPGGLHVMVKEIKPGLAIGDSVSVQLVFASGNKAQFLVPVVANPVQAPALKDGAKAAHHH